MPLRCLLAELEALLRDMEQAHKNIYGSGYTLDNTMTPYITRLEALLNSHQPG